MLHVAGARGDYRQAQRLEEQGRIQAARLRALARATRAFAEAGLGLRPLLETVAREVSMVFEAGAGVGLAAREGRGLLMRKVHHPRTEALAALVKARAPMNVGPAVAQVLQTGQSVMVTIPDDGGAASPGPGGGNGGGGGGNGTGGSVVVRAARESIRGMMLAPLRGSQRVLGVVWVSRGRSDPPFAARDLAMLEDLGERAALALENARTLRRARRAAERTQLLQAVTAAIAEPLTAPAVAEVVLREACDSFGAASGVLYRLSDDGRELVALAANGSLADGADPRLRRLAVDDPVPRCRRRCARGRPCCSPAPPSAPSSSRPSPGRPRSSAPAPPSRSCCTGGPSVAWAWCSPKTAPGRART